MLRQVRARGIVASGAALLLSACAGGTTVELVSRASQPLESVSVEFTGGSTAPQQIQPGHAATLRFDPTGESSLKVLYQTSAGLQTCEVDTYLESGYRAQFEIELHEDSCTVIRDEVKLPSLIGAAPPVPMTVFLLAPHTPALIPRMARVGTSGRAAIYGPGPLLTQADAGKKRRPESLTAGRWV